MPTLGALTANDYVLSFVGGTPKLTNTADGTSVTPTGAGTVASPYTAAGISIVLSGTPANGDQFLVQPTATAAGSPQVVLSNPVANCRRRRGQDRGRRRQHRCRHHQFGHRARCRRNPNLLTPVTIAFTSPTTYTINGGAPNAYTSGGNIAANGWQVQISGAPASGDSFHGDQQCRRHRRQPQRARLPPTRRTSACCKTAPPASPAGSARLITGLGSQAQQINTAQTAQAAVNAQALTSVQSTSGVNLDEEAASLLQWQQAYQAAAQALTIGNSLFTTLIDSVNGTFS